MFNRFFPRLEDYGACQKLWYGRMEKEAIETFQRMSGASATELKVMFKAL